MDFQFCRNCQAANPAFARFCDHCEADLLAETEPEKVEKSFTAPRRTMNRWLYTGAYLALLATALFITRSPGRNVSAYALLAVGLLFTIFHLTFIWNMWRALDDGKTSITPAKAVGLHFIPLFNLLWAGLVILAFPGAYNDFGRRHNAAAHELSSGLYFAYFILLTLVFLGYFIPLLTYLMYIQPFFYIAVVYATCGAVNRLAESSEERKTDTIPGFGLTTK